MKSFELRNAAVIKQAEGGVKRGNCQDKSSVCSISSIWCEIVSASDQINDITQKSNLPDYSILAPLFTKYQNYSNDIPLRILGRVVLALHHWIDLHL